MSSAPSPDNIPRNEVWTDSPDTILVIFDGPWDTTARPGPPHIPPYSPHGKPPEQTPQPPTKGDDDLPKGDSA